MFSVALLTSALLASVAGRIYERCELARDLQTLGVSKDHLATWVCIAFHESRFDTAARNPNSGDHGLLQISELYWCGPGKACSVPCSAFRDEDISDDVKCAQQIYEEHTRLQGDGFLAWVVYPHHCRYNAKKYLADCDGYIKDIVYANDIDRGRSLKSRHRVGQQGHNNETTAYFKKFPNIDDLKPPYIAINTLLRGKFANTFEKEVNHVDSVYYDSNKKQPFEWLSNRLFKGNTGNIPTLKLDNIDELKPPFYGAKSSFENREASLSTTLRTTTTIDPAIKDIKPPNPRRIESNQFRRRKMMSYSNSNEKNIVMKAPESYSPAATKNDVQFPVTTSSPVLETTATQRFRYIITSHSQPTLHRNQTYFSLNNKEELHNKDHMENNRSKNVSLPASKTEISPNKLSTSYTTFQEFIISPTTSPTVPPPLHKPEAFKNDVGKELSVSIAHDPQEFIKLNTPPVLHLMDKKEIKGNENISTTEKPTTLLKSTTVVDSFTGKGAFVRKLPITPTHSTAATNTWFNRKEYQFKSRQETELTTIKPRPTRPWVTFTPISKYTSSKSFQSESSTSRSITLSPTTLKKSINIFPTQQPSTTVKATTQSIFDLYLKPTKRPNISFSFPEFKDSPFKLRIFSGGTTTLSPSFLNSAKVRSSSANIENPNQKIS